LLDNFAFELLKPTFYEIQKLSLMRLLGKLLGFSQVKVAQGELKSKSGKAPHTREDWAKNARHKIRNLRF